MAAVDADQPGSADSPCQDDTRAQELPQGGMDRPQGLPEGQCELARRELPLGIDAQHPKDADLRPGAQDILEHAPEIAIGLFRYFDYKYDFSNEDRRTRANGSLSSSASSIRSVGRSSPGT